MDVRESKEELAAMALRVSPHLVYLDDVYAADYIFDDLCCWLYCRYKGRTA